MPIKWSISNSDTKAVITMKFEDYSPEIQAKLMEIGNAAADAVESQESPAEGIPEDSPNFSSELELSRLINRRKAELEYIDARIAQMVLLMHERGQSCGAAGIYRGGDRVSSVACGAHVWSFLSAKKVLHTGSTKANRMEGARAHGSFHGACADGGIPH